MREKASMTASQVESQIRTQVACIKRKKLPAEKLEAEYRKFDGIYHAAVVDGCSTASAYIYREAFRRVLDECENKWQADDSATGGD